MGGPTTPLKNFSDTYVSEKYPNKRYPSVNKIFLADGSAADTRFGYLYPGLPSGITGTTLTAGKLRVHSGKGFSGSVTMTVSRLTSKFSASRVTWNTKPTFTSANQASVTKTNAPEGTVWEFDVQAMLQTVANGAPWYGFRISITGSSAKWIYSAQAADQFRPELEIAWSDSPDQPENLIPDNGKAVSVAKPTLQWDFVDPSGDETMQSATVKLYGSKANADADTAPLLNVTVPTSVPEFDLDDPAAAAWAGLAADGQVWWRVLNTDGAGLPSALSDTATFVRKTKGNLAINNPAAGNPAFVNESTPPFSWSFTGRTQAKYHVILTTPETPAKWVWDSGIITGTETAITPDPNKITEVGKTYRLIVRVYDDQNRQEVPDDPTYVEATRDFVYQLSSSVSTVSNLQIALDPYVGKATLTWEDGTAPDEYVFLRDGKEVETEAPVDVFVSGTSYSWVDDAPAPRKQHTWEVARKVNGVTSSGNPTVQGTPKVVGPVLSRIGGGSAVVMLNPNVAAERVETSDVHYILGDAPPILITQSIRGYEGSVTGVLADGTVPGRSAEDMLENFEWMKQNPGTELKFTWINKVLRVVVRNLSDEPVVYPDGTIDYVISFEFFEVGF